MSRLILASASPRRKEILGLMGLKFIVIPSQCEEIATEKEPGRLVMSLSRQKAEDVALSATEGDIIIGADTIVVLDNKVLGKPHDRQDAADMIRRMSGRAHHVYTGVTLIKKGADSESEDQTETFFVCTEVNVAPMDEQEISDYLDTGEYSDKAGGYGIQGRFAPYITGINGDYYNVVGLPAAELHRRLKHFI